MLPLTFAEPADYDRVTGNDKVSIVGLAGLVPDEQLTVAVTPADGTTSRCPHPLPCR